MKKSCILFFVIAPCLADSLSDLQTYINDIVLPRATLRAGQPPLTVPGIKGTIDEYVNKIRSIVIADTQLQQEVNRLTQELMANKQQLVSAQQKSSSALADAQAKQEAAVGVLQKNFEQEKVQYENQQNALQSKLNEVQSALTKAQKERDSIFSVQQEKIANLETKEASFLEDTEKFKTQIKTLAQQLKDLAAVKDSKIDTLQAQVAKTTSEYEKFKSDILRMIETANKAL